ncbi:MAG: hypothetical protein ACI9QD_000064 [Thermoproteota archaeon]|jgi:hypothetical protein
MKKLLSMLVFVSVCAFASVIPSEQLGLANNYLSDFVSNPFFTLEVKSGNINEAKLLDKLVIESVVLAEVEIKLTTELKDDELILKLDAAVQDTASSYEAMVEELIVMMPDLVNQYQDYNVEYTIDRNEERTNIKLSITPKDTTSTLNHIKGDITITKDGLITVSVEISAKAMATMVKKGQVALTNIFKSMVNQQEPTEDDMNVLFDIYDAAMNEM